MTSSCFVWLDNEVLSSNFFNMMWLIFVVDVDVDVDVNVDVDVDMDVGVNIDFDVDVDVDIEVDVDVDVDVLLTPQVEFCCLTTVFAISGCRLVYD